MKRFIELPYEEKVEMGKLSHEFVASVFDKKKVVEETVVEIMR
jgi:galacturonosyltransferase